MYPSVTRWAKAKGIPKELYRGERKLGGWLIQCANLDDESRVISQRSFMELIDMRGRGRDPIGHRMASIIESPFAKSPKVNQLVLDIKNPVKFLTRNGVMSYGYSVETVIDYCRVILDLRKYGAVTGEVFKRYADRAEGFLVSFAKGGIIALIDEITGYQEVRAKDALAQILGADLAIVQAHRQGVPKEFIAEAFRRSRETVNNVILQDARKTTP